MRILLNELTSQSGQVSDDDLRALYAPCKEIWLRANFVSTVDGGATGDDGLSGSINNAADKRVFDALRASADVLIVGAGTLRNEGYGVPDLPLVVVSRRAAIPTGLTDAPPGRILMATWGGAAGLAEARATLGEEHVIVTGRDGMDLAALRDALVERGLKHQLSEGGPHLFGSLLHAGLVDELDLTLSPKLVAGAGPRITVGAPIDLPARPALLLEEDGTLLGRWLL